MNFPEYLKISELSRISETPVSTIRHYLNEGLLPQPVKTGKTMAYYTRVHIELLAIIKKMKNEEKLPLGIIKEELHSRTREAEIEQETERIYTGRRADIIQSAIRLFRDKGFKDTSITDIVDDAGIGRGTFYLNFSNKDELFFECADKIFLDMDNNFQGIHREKDIPKKLMNRTLFFIKSYPNLIDMINLVRGASVGDKPEFGDKLEQIMNNLVDPIKQDLDRGVEQGSIRDVDTEIAAHMLMGIAEYTTYLFYEESDFSVKELIESGKIEELIKAGWDIVYNGILSEEEA